LVKKAACTIDSALDSTGSDSQFSSYDTHDNAAMLDLTTKQPINKTIFTTHITSTISPQNDWAEFT
jgi:hypothetical protein